jgi:uncharacterized membrane protein
MRFSSLHYFPLAWPFLVLLFSLFIVAVALIELNILTYAYRRMGIRPRFVWAILLLSLLGSYVNIPVAELPPEEVVSGKLVDFFGVTYVVPTVQRWPGTIIAVNVGGALIPAVLSFYLLVRNRLYLRGALAVVVVAVIVHALARPVRGVGISVPILVPPLVAALAAMVLSWRHAPPLAYIAGSLGTLIGADLLNLGRIQGLGAPIASIGGAGTFDGVFLTGILAGLLPPGGEDAPVAEGATRRV